jgi:hypothetical protein
VGGDDHERVFFLRDAGFQEGQALAHGHSGQPEDGQTARVETAVRRVDAEPTDPSLLDA